MNKRKIISVLGKIILTEGLLMIPSLLTSLIYRDGDAGAFLITILLAGVLGLICCSVKQSDQRMSSRDGYFIVATAWIVISLIGALPLYLGGGFKSYFNALFEIVSGFTTTGASVLSNPETLGHGVLFWRSFTHWIGGMGVLVFVLMVMPMENDNSMHLVRAEVPGPTAGKLVPRMRTTSMILYGIYAIMTLVLVVILKILGMGLFDSLCIAFGTAGTGGFAVTGAGIAAYDSLAIEVTLGIFMLLFGVNFTAYHLILQKKVEDVFQVSSIITTTGFSTADYDLWPEFSKHVLVLLMIVGACAGSTGGGLKISRVIILVKSFVLEIRQIINPREIVTVRLNGKPVDKKTLSSTRIYAAAYLILICICTLIISLDGFDLTTNLTAVLSCFNNIGPGLNMVGPMQNFSIYSDWAQVVLSVVMLTGKLEIFPMFLLLAKSAHDK